MLVLNLELFFIYKSQFATRVIKVSSRLIHTHILLLNKVTLFVELDASNKKVTALEASLQNEIREQNLSKYANKFFFIYFFRDI